MNPIDFGFQTAAGGWTFAGLTVLSLISLVLVYLLFRADHRFERVQEACNALSKILTKLGFHDLPEILDRIVIKDWDGLYEKIKSVREKYSDSKQRDAALEELQVNMLTLALEDPNRRGKVFEIVDRYRDAAATKLRNDYVALQVQQKLAGILAGGATGAVVGGPAGAAAGAATAAVEQAAQAVAAATK